MINFEVKTNIKNGTELKGYDFAGGVQNESVAPIKKASNLSIKGSLFLWYQLGSNQRHKDFQSFALPTEL
jgi:hypothetical protein